MRPFFALLEALLGAASGRNVRYARLSVHREPPMTSSQDNHFPDGRSASQSIDKDELQDSVQSRDADDESLLNEPSFIVGIGASAGGLEALERFFKAVPEDSGMAFVVIQHLSPDFHSLMDELLARFTRLPIVRVSTQVLPQADTIYLLQPRKIMVMHHGQLQSYDKPNDERLSMPINTFFRSLAREVGERAIAVVLSGTGTDGTIGLSDVHEAGGLVLAQSLETAKFDGMPRSAIATNQVDLVLAPEEMPAALLAYAANPSAPLLQKSAAASPSTLLGVPAVIDRLREVYGLDFSYYKPATISRRMERRWTLGHEPTLDAYCERILRDPEELDELYKDLLIGVTRFFRDPEAFAILERIVVPEILEQVPPNEEVRIWVAGCATGEEAYSLAMLFLEAMAARKREPNLRIFASDMHRKSLQTAAEGLYSEASVAELSEERKTRFFEREAGGMRVTALLRKHILFSVHNVIRDAPFTRIDLVSCRNLLIYLRPAAQVKALSSFHFGLKVRSFLLLGPSEGVSELHNEFDTVDRQWKVFRKSRDSRLPVDFRAELVTSPGRQITHSTTPGDLRMSRIYDAILRRYVPSAVLVDSRRDIVHVFGDADRYLRVPPGRMSSDLVALTRGDLRLAVSSALQAAMKRRESVTCHDVQIEDTGEVLDVVADPLPDSVSNERYVLICFMLQRKQVAAAPPTSVDITVDGEIRSRIHQLEAELQLAKESLQTTVEELETSNEELQASNEELQASNEELQSTNEELHSVNEELYSVNAEHEQKIKDLNRVSTDLKNLIQATEIGTVFLDAEMKIRFFTPSAAKLFNLLHQDIDRDIRHITSQIKDDDVFEDIALVAQTRSPRTKRIATADGKSYLRRVMPYFDIDRNPSGLVLTFVDITELTFSEEQRTKLNHELQTNLIGRRETEERFRLIVENALDAMLTIDSSGNISMFNPKAESMFGYTSQELRGQNIHLLIPDEFRDNHRKLFTSYLGAPSPRSMGVGRSLYAKRKDGSVFPVEVGLSPITNSEGTEVLVIISDLTRQKQIEGERDEILRKITESERLESLWLLAGGIAHDFNNLLTGIMASASLLASDKNLDPHARETVALIRESSVRAAELCQQLLAYSGRSRFIFRILDVNELVRSTAKLAQSAVVGSSVELSFDLTSDLPPVQMDSTQIRQLIMNLVINAVEAIGPHPGTVTIRTQLVEMTPAMRQSAVQFDDALEGIVVCIEVKDNGIGIAPADVQRIFEPFFTTKFTGRGLGLAAVLGIVRGHRGAVLVDSVVGAGTSFRILLPISSKAQDEVDAEPIQSARGHEHAGAVLLVDDEDMIRFVAERILTESGFDVDVSADGHDALRRISERSSPYDLIVLDLTMPGMSGVEVFHAVRIQNPSQRVILMSGFSPEEVLQRLGSEEPDGFLAKPFDYGTMLAVIQHALQDGNKKPK